MTVFEVAALWLVGALIGVLAAQRKGFSLTVGVLGGVLLGPFAVLLFLVPRRHRRCPSCVAWIPRSAATCQHCGRDVPALLPTAPPEPAYATIYRDTAITIAVWSAGISAVVLTVLHLLV